MGTVTLSQDRTKFVVNIDGRNEVAVMKAAFKATPACDDISQEQELESFETSIDNLGNICALWATGFDWRPEALRVLVDSLMPLAQRKNMFRLSSAFDKRDPKPGEQLPR